MYDPLIWYTAGSPSVLMNEERGGKKNFCANTNPSPSNYQCDNKTLWMAECLGFIANNHNGSTEIFLSCRSLSVLKPLKINHNFYSARPLRESHHGQELVWKRTACGPGRSLFTLGHSQLLGTKTFSFLLHSCTIWCNMDSGTRKRKHSALAAQRIQTEAFCYLTRCTLNGSII